MKFLYDTGKRIQKKLFPNLVNTQYLYFDILEAYLKKCSNWLDIGCGKNILYGWIPNSIKIKKLTEDDKIFVIGLEYVKEDLKANSDIKGKISGIVEHLPLKDYKIDFITANMVMEHLKDPRNSIAEISRVMSEDSTLIFHTPNLFNYATFSSLILPQIFKKKLIDISEGRIESDIFRTYYRINSVKKIKKLLSHNGFEVIEIKMIQSTPVSYFLGPFVIFELIMIKILQFDFFKYFRSNFIVIAKKK